jgi:hypothetical protein
MDNDMILSGEKQNEKGARVKRPAPTITALRAASFVMIFPPPVLNVIPIVAGLRFEHAWLLGATSS